ncbi:MAG TPA: ABC transporter permease [Nitrososphaerales archaeon]|nr:ABC transporter permease [Nitrososphaerales archaeon]
MAAPQVLRLMYRNIRVNVDPGSLMILIGLPALYLIFFGFGFGSIVSSEEASKSAYLNFLTPGIMSFQAVMAGTVGGSMLWADRRFGMLAQLLMGPFTRIQYLFGIMITSVTFGLAGAFVMLVGAYLLIGSISLTFFGAAVIFGSIALGSIFFGSLMLLISAMVKSQNAYNSIQILILFVVNFASTVFYPLSSSLPLPIKALFEVNPLTYIANASRNGYAGVLPLSSAYEIALLFVETILVLVLATRAYVRSDVSFE